MGIGDWILMTLFFASFLGSCASLGAPAKEEKT